ncbi:hypothetical protein YTPLAS18_10280 [Nitrospira sp.]|nr:hypothetical protein YTPLAS18_10280 [Nitrospira sp.]
MKLSELEEQVMVLVAAGPMDIDNLLSRFPRAQWSHVIVAVDALSRRSVVSLHKASGRSYMVARGSQVSSHEAR